MKKRKSKSAEDEQLQGATKKRLKYDLSWLTAGLAGTEPFEGLSFFLHHVFFYLINVLNFVFISPEKVCSGSRGV